MRRLLAAAALTAAACQCAVAAPEAASADGRWRVAGQGAGVVVFDNGQPVKTLPARSLQGREDAQVRSVRFLPARRSFVIAFDDTLRELWELSVDSDAPAIYDGLVHDWRLREAIPSPGFLGVRRTPLEAPVRSIAADERGSAYVLVQTPDAWLLVNLDVRRAIARYAEPLQAGR